LGVGDVLLDVLAELGDVDSMLAPRAGCKELLTKGVFFYIPEYAIPQGYRKPCEKAPRLTID
jgi:hypothetical protein